MRLFLLVRSLAGQAKAPLKGVATSVLQQLHKHAAASADGGGGDQRWAKLSQWAPLRSANVKSVCVSSHRVVYDAALKTVNQVLDL